MTFDRKLYEVLNKLDKTSTLYFICSKTGAGIGDERWKSNCQNEKSHVFHCRVHNYYVFSCDEHKGYWETFAPSAIKEVTDEFRISEGT